MSTGGLMVGLLLGLFGAVATAQVPQDVVLVAGDDDQVLGFDTSGSAWVSNPFVDETRPALDPAITDLVVDGNDDVFSTFAGDMDVYRLDAVSGWVSEATVPGALDPIVGMHAMWDDHLMVATANTRTLYEVDPVAGTASSVATIAQVSSASDTIVLFELVGATAYMVVGSGSTYALVTYNFHFDEQTTYNTLPGEPSTLHVLQRPSPTAYMTFPGSPNDTLRAIRGNSLRFSSSLSGAAVDLDQAWDGSLWALYDDGTVWSIDAKSGEEQGVTALIGSGLPTGAGVLFSGAQNAVDGCRNNPYRFTPDTCGCDYLDVPATPSGTACEHYSSTVGSGVTLGDAAVLESGAAVGPGASIGARSVVAARSTVGANATIGTDSVVGRNAIIGASVVVGDDVMIGRSAEVTAGSIGNFAVVGYSSLINNAVVDGGSVIGALVTLGGTWSVGTSGVGSPVTIARGAELVGGGTLGRGTVIGPDVSAAGSLSTGEACRLRKDVSFNGSAVLGDSVRIGRDASAGTNIEIRDGTRIGTNAALGPNQCVPAGTVVPNQGSVTGSTCP